MESDPSQGQAPSSSSRSPSTQTDFYLYFLAAARTRNLPSAESGV